MDSRSCKGLFSVDLDLVFTKGPPSQLLNQDPNTPCLVGVSRANTSRSCRPLKLCKPGLCKVLHGHQACYSIIYFEYQLIVVQIMLQH